jgi:hypothetical protein
MSGDLVGLTKLHRDTYNALTNWAEALGYGKWFHSRWIEPQWLAWLIALLGAEEDKPELFPHGKCATVQFLQDILEKAAVAELKSKPGA